jgi:hypothetical protein
MCPWAAPQLSASGLPDSPVPAWATKQKLLSDQAHGPVLTIVYIFVYTYANRGRVKYAARETMP